MTTENANPQDQEIEVTNEVANIKEPRKIKIVPTRGEKKTIEFEGNTWKELRSVIERNGYDLNNMKCVESIFRHTLEHDEAIIPDGDFKLFLMPYKSKSGALDRKELFLEINKIKEKDPASKSYFGNITQIKTEKLQELLDNYHGTDKAVDKKKRNRVDKTVGQAIASVVDSVKTAKEADPKEDTLYEEVKKMSDSDKLYLIIKLLTDIHASTVNKPLVSESEVEVTPVKSQAEIEEEERIEKERKEAKEREEKERKEKEEREAKEKEEQRLKKEEENRKKEEERKRKEKEDREDEEELRSLGRGLKDVKL